MASPNETLFWKKKELLSFILSILVFFIHISSFAQYSSNEGVISIVNERTAFFFKVALSFFSVPMFFIFSGISFFKNYDNSQYLKKIKSRVFTLIIPYLLWNTIWTVFDIVCSYTFLSQYFMGRPKFVLTLANVLRGIFLYGCNGPFWFIFNLILFSLAAPLVHLVVRNKYVGIASVCLLIALNSRGMLSYAFTLFSPTSITFYLIGAIIGEHYFDFAARKSSKTMQWSSMIFLLTYIILRNLFPTHPHSYKILLQAIVFPLVAFSLWNITDMFIHKIKPKKIYSRSFAVYAMHVNFSAIITKLVFLCLPKSAWMAIPNFIITVILTLSAINFVCIFLEKFLPKVYSILMGKGLKYIKKTSKTAE
ncbi:MAG: acyltransferase [Clostridia bacterium]|nr:acyltransferase [Clostridia bacterium]